AEDAWHAPCAPSFVLPLSEWPLGWSIAVFALGGVVVAVFGVRLTRLADELAERTRLGEALVGAVLLGGITSLPEIGASATAALSGHAELATSNAVGSIAAQTMFLGVADLAHRGVKRRTLPGSNLRSPGRTRNVSDDCAARPHWDPAHGHASARAPRPGQHRPGEFPHLHRVRRGLYCARPRGVSL